MNHKIMLRAWKWARDTQSDNQDQPEGIMDYFPYCLNETIREWEEANDERREELFGNYEIIDPRVRRNVCAT